MERKYVTPRADYREKIEALGFDFHGDYWREEAYYRFTSDEIERLEKATAEAYRMYCEAAGYIIEKDPEWMERFLRLPLEVCRRIRESWDADELSLYGRFDFMLDEKGVPRILEFNADTPTSLLEASVIQWQWKKRSFRSLTSITASTRDWSSRGKILSLRAAMCILPECWRTMKIQARCNIWQVRQWKPGILPVCWT